MRGAHYRLWRVWLVCSTVSTVAEDVSPRHFRWPSPENDPWRSLPSIAPDEGSAGPWIGDIIGQCHPRGSDNPALERRFWRSGRDRRCSDLRDYPALTTSSRTDNTQRFSTCRCSENIRGIIRLS